MNTCTLSTITPPRGAQLFGTGIWPAAPGHAIARRKDGALMVVSEGRIRWELLAIVIDADDITVTVRCPHDPTHTHSHGRAGLDHECVGDRAGHGGCAGYVVADLHRLQQRYDAGERWPALKIPRRRRRP